MRLFWKVYLSSLALLLLSVGLVATFATLNHARLAAERLEREQKRLAVLAASQVEAGYHEQNWPFELLATVAENEAFLFWRIVDGRGKAVLTSSPPADSERTFLAEPAGVGSEPFLLAGPGAYAQTWVVPMRMRMGARPWTLWLGFHDRTQRLRRWYIIRTNALTATVIALALIPISLSITRRLLRPLEALTAAAGEMASGHLDVCLPRRGSGEIGRLVSAFDAMITDIKSRDTQIREKVQALQQAQNELETRVEQRTAELRQEVAERRKVEMSLREAHARTEAIVAAISSILIGLDGNRRVTSWNSAAEAVFGRPARDVLGRPIRDCGIGWDWPAVEPAVAACDGNDRPVRLDDVGFRGSDGRRGLLGLTISPVRNGDSSPSGCLIVGSDITERRALEQHLARAQKLEAIGQLAAGIAHEINTPIQFVGDNTRFLQESYAHLQRVLEAQAQVVVQAKAGAVAAESIAQADEVARQVDVGYLLAEIPAAAAQSLDGVERVAKIVRAMKAFSHPGRDEKSAVDLGAAIESTVTVSRNEWKDVADLTTDLDPELPPVPCYGPDLNQVLLNLIVNAAHAIADAVGDSGRKGTITITTRRVGRWAEIRVADTGTGISEDVRPRIFDPFFTTKDVGRGTGQGLAMAHAIVVDKHSGTIDFESAVGTGTAFVVRLPIADPAKETIR